MEINKIKEIQDNMIEKVEVKSEKWGKDTFIYCPVCGKIMEVNNEYNRYNEK